ncbi:type 4a pilus biogenesis protein PilO [Wenzhouxiangella sp. XN24]|uniref:type 4a pilus biogenesis protein PilO n=1 Tax=Wenzhouxiangella sp. XN24 TaxID=2713569 RepID=UPI0013ECE5D8|nr:type 4a pilus biogenesis protein PilO [Wenzhouxiangella sp. XN24]NGX17442.1 type 4a pilus biogenesis protein PilO [Wenzhouxiangella sp. XN24]
MNFIDQLRGLDTQDIGRWPPLFRGIAIGIIFVLVAVGGTYYFVWRNKIPQLEQVQRQELDLRATFESRQRLAANLDAYKDQLEEVERTFGAMLRQLPGETEVPSLLIDISQTGLAAGLEERLFQPMSEVTREAYSELPIKMQLVGTYHELGNFVSGVVALPRIVTLHDVVLKPEQTGDRNAAPSQRLVMDVTAKTYRYLEDEDPGQ